MVSVWGLGFFLAGLTLVAVELGYPRRYVGVLGVVLASVGLVLMVLPADLALHYQVLAALGAGLLTAAIAVPFYRRWAPPVGPMTLPRVGAGDLAVVLEPISPNRPGLVRAGGIAWTAKADAQIPTNTTVRILVVDQNELWVEAESVAPPQDGDRDQDDDRRTE